MSLNLQKTYEFQSPTRIDLVGGTLDCWPVYALLGGESRVINAAIDIYTKASLKFSDKIHIKTTSGSYDFKTMSDFLKVSHTQLSLLQKVVNYYQFNQPFSIDFSSDSPQGGGLGGSSSLCITFLKLFEHLSPKNLTPYQMITVASNLEAEVLGTVTGTQDYIPALKGGVHQISYSPCGFEFKPFPLEAQFVQDNFSLIYTGRPHHSGLNNWRVLKRLVDASPPSVRKAFESLQKLSLKAGDLFNQKDIKTVFDEEWKIRQLLSNTYVSEEMQRLYDKAVSLGGSAKGLGAGGGGCLLAFVPGKKENFESYVQSFDFALKALSFNLALA